MQTTQKGTTVAWQSTHREHGGSDDGRSVAPCCAPSVLQEANDLRRFIRCMDCISIIPPSDKNCHFRYNVSMKIYTIPQTAKLLDCSERQIFRYLANGKLKGSKVGKWRFTEDDIKTFLKAGRVESKRQTKK